jgi:toxin ParE1/3/4
VARYVLTNKAVSDLSSIWDYTFEVWSENQADKYHQLLVDGFEELAGAPDKGKSFEEIEIGLKGFRVAKHIIFYLIGDNRIEIVRILHEQMDLRQHLND